MRFGCLSEGEFRGTRYPSEFRIARVEALELGVHVTGPCPPNSGSKNRAWSESPYTTRPVAVSRTAEADLVDEFAVLAQVAVHTAPVGQRW